MQKILSRNSGFTLLELVLVLLIITVLASTIMIPMGTRQSTKNINAVEKQLEEVKKSLLAYATLNNGFMPCSGKDGSLCKPTKQQLLNAENILPVMPLGVEVTDPWGNPFLYFPTNNFSKDAKTLFTEKLSSNAEPTEMIQIAGKRQPACPFKSDQWLNNVKTVVAVIYSTGLNGRSEQPANTANTTANTYCFYDMPVRTRIDRQNMNEDYDDIVIWITKNNYVYQMITNGTLP